VVLAGTDGDQASSESLSVGRGRRFSDIPMRSGDAVLNL
jgi:hypothetical protein